MPLLTFIYWCVDKEKGKKIAFVGIVGCNPVKILLRFLLGIAVVGVIFLGRHFLNHVGAIESNLVAYTFAVLLHTLYLPLLQQLQVFHSYLQK